MIVNRWLCLLKVYFSEKKSRGTAERQEEPSFVGPFIPTLDAFVYKHPGSARYTVEFHKESYNSNVRSPKNYFHSWNYIRIIVQLFLSVYVQLLFRIRNYIYKLNCIDTLQYL